MGTFGIEQYGLDEYGTLGGASPIPIVPPIIIPSSGTTLGGTPFSILLSNISASQYGDSFVGPALSGLWTNISSGGSVSLSHGLTLNVPTTGGLAGIRSTTLFNNFDVSIPFSFSSTIETLNPSNLTFVYLMARIDTNNYFSINVVWDHVHGALVTIAMCQSGIISTLATIPFAGLSSTIRLVRYNGRIQAYLGGVLQYDAAGWHNDVVNMEIASTSTSTPLSLATKVNSFNVNMLITFGNQICPNGGEVGRRIVGTTPPYSLPVTVEVIVHNPVESISLGLSAFTYTVPRQLTISPVSSTNRIFVSNDPSLRDTSDVLTGLRLFSG